MDDRDNQKFKPTSGKAKANATARRFIILMVAIYVVLVLNAVVAMAHLVVSKCIIASFPPIMSPREGLLAIPSHTFILPHPQQIFILR
jgi:hypothetical protein